MFNKLVQTILVTVIGLATGVGTTMPAAQAAIRTNAPLEIARVEKPASEMKCLEAFVNSNFSYAHRLCLSLARQGMRDAQLVTGLMYVLGEGTEKNTDLAKMWLQEALRNGSSEAKEVLIDFKLMD